MQHYSGLINIFTLILLITNEAERIGHNEKNFWKRSFFFSKPSTVCMLNIKKDHSNERKK